VRRTGFDWAFLFLFNLYFMHYILDSINERSLHLEPNRDLGSVQITIKDDEREINIYLDEDGLFELIGALHHIQKQLKK
jgi:hypothetical protein